MPLRVLIVQHGLFPGFVAPIAKEWAKSLWRIGVDVQVAVIGQRSNESAAEPLEFPIHTVSDSSRTRAYGDLRRLVRDVDVVHYFLGRGMELLPLLDRRPKYVFHHISVSVTGRSLKDGLINFAKRLQPLLADHVIFTDQALATALKPVGLASVSLLPVGYPDDLFYPCPARPATTEKRLLYHGAVRYQRRLEDLVQVLARLPQEYTLTIIGGGPPSDESYRDSLADLAESLGCAGRLRLIKMPQAEIRTVIDETYLCLSYVPMVEWFQDQFVMKTIEYLACHRPVLTTATRYTKQFSETIGPDRLLLSDGSVDDLVAKIERAHEYVERFYAPQNLASLTSALQPYSSRHLVETELVPIYQSMLARS